MQQMHLQPSAPGAGQSGMVAKRRIQAVKTGRKEGSWRARETNWIRIQRNICQALLAVVWTMDNAHNAAALSFSLICH